MSVGLKRLILKLCLQIVLGYFGVIVIIFCDSTESQPKSLKSDYLLSKSMPHVALDYVQSCVLFNFR